MNTGRDNELNVLKLTLHDRLIGYLSGFVNGRNVLMFADEFREDANRPTFSLITHPRFPRSDKVMAEPWIRNQRLHPTLSNLLPEALKQLPMNEQHKKHLQRHWGMLQNDFRLR